MKVLKNLDHEVNHYENVLNHYQIKYDFLGKKMIVFFIEYIV